MKPIALFSMTLLLSAQVFASTYRCVDVHGDQAELRISGRDVTWSEPARGASSTACFVGLDSALSSARRGYQLFKLVDFYTTADSIYMLALSGRAGKRLKAAVYFDNDDHEEELQNFDCVRGR